MPVGGRRYSRKYAAREAPFFDGGGRRLAGRGGGASSRAMHALAKLPELLTPREMAACDRLTIAAGTPGIVLMERAGAAVAEAAAARLRDARTRDDPVRARRQWRRRVYRRPAAGRAGLTVELYLLGDRASLKGDPALAAERFGGDVRPAEDFDPAGADLVIDALYGAGLSRDVDGVARACVEKHQCALADAERSCWRSISPSGIDGETGAVRGVAVRADASVTFHRFKPGHLLLPGRELAGELMLADIGIAPQALEALGPRAFANGPLSLARRPSRFRARSSHKYTRGAALVLSGAAHRTGAARLAARAALRAGAGLVALASPPDAVAVNAAHLTAVMIEPFDGRAEFERLLADSRRNAMLIGPGAGLGPETRGLVEAALTHRLGPGRARSCSTPTRSALSPARPRLWPD